MRSAIFYSLGFVALVAGVGCNTDNRTLSNDDEKGGSTGAHSGGSAGQAGQSAKGGSGGGNGGNTSGNGGTVGNAGASGNASSTAGSSGNTGKGGGAGGGGKSSNVGGSTGKGGGGTGGSDASGGATGTGGDTGGGNDGGAAEAAAPVGVTPNCDTSGKCTFAWDKYKFVVDSKGGARIIEFSLDGTNFLVDSTTSSDAYGSTFLTSPQSDFPSWPPPAAMDSGEYTKQDCGSTTCLKLASAKFSVTGSSPKITLEKKFSINATSGVVTILYSIVVPSDSSGSVKYAPWEVTRTKADGITFWPTGSKAPWPGNSMKLPATSDAKGYTFFPYVKPTENAKLNADGGSKGYIAQVNGDLMLVKSWKDVAGTDQDWEAEAEIEVYANPNGKYIEVEDQGPYTSLAVGNRLDWEVHWALQKLASAISSPSSAVGDSALIEKADSMATLR